MTVSLLAARSKRTTWKDPRSGDDDDDDDNDRDIWACHQKGNQTYVFPKNLWDDDDDDEDEVCDSEKDAVCLFIRLFVV